MHRALVAPIAVLVFVMAVAVASASNPLAPPVPSQPVTWQAHAGAQTGDQAIQALAFFPTDVFVNVGDTITWNFDAAEPHTVTFLAPGQAPPAAGTSPSPSGSTFNGSFLNSGTIVGPDQAYSVVFGAAGDYTYLCLIHRVTMTARVHVNPAGSPYPHTQSEYNRQARALAGLDLEDGSDIRTDNLDAARDAGKGHVITGGGDGQVFVARFLPAVQRVRVGDTVTWTNPDSISPHTVTFGPAPANVAAPAGNDASFHATISAAVTSTVSSGFIGVRRASTDFSVTFVAPGTYSYFCALHAALGMTGTIVVDRR